MKTKILTLACAFLLTLWGSTLWAAGAQSNAPAEVRAQVMEKIVKADKVLLGLRWIGAPPAGAAGAEGRVLVLFTAGADGRPDLAAPANQKILAALGPEPGDILVLKILYGPKGWQAKEVRFAASDAAVSFPGREKIAPGLVAGLLAPGSTAPVIATLNTDATGKKLQELVKKLLRGLPRGSFEPGQSLDRLPVVTGRASLKALMALAASPLVKAVQADEKSLPAAAGSVPAVEVLK